MVEYERPSVLTALLATTLLFAASRPNAAALEPGIGESSDSLRRPVPVDSVRVVSYEKPRLTMVTWGTVPDPCWQSDRAVVDRNERSTTVRWIARRNPEEMCIQVISALQDTLSFRVEPGSPHTFSFWRSDSTRLDTTLTLDADE